MSAPKQPAPTEEARWHGSPVRQQVTDTLRRELRLAGVVGTDGMIMRAAGYGEGYLAALSHVDNFQNRHEAEKGKKVHIPYSNPNQKEDDHD